MAWVIPIAGYPSTRGCAYKCGCPHSPRLVPFRFPYRCEHGCEGCLCYRWFQAMVEPQEPGDVADLLVEAEMENDAVAVPDPARQLATSSSDEDEAGGDPPSRPAVAPSLGRSSLRSGTTVPSVGGQPCMATPGVGAVGSLPQDGPPGGGGGDFPPTPAGKGIRVSGRPVAWQPPWRMEFFIRRLPDRRLPSAHRSWRRLPQGSFSLLCRGWWWSQRHLRPWRWIAGATPGGCPLFFFLLGLEWLNRRGWPWDCRQCWRSFRGRPGLLG